MADLDGKALALQRSVQVVFGGVCFDEPRHRQSSQAATSSGYIKRQREPSRQVREFEGSTTCLSSFTQSQSCTASPFSFAMWSSVSRQRRR